MANKFNFENRQREIVQLVIRRWQAQNGKECKNAPDPLGPTRIDKKLFQSYAVCMSQLRTAEIICPECKKESFVRREGVYEGFRRVGEKITCASCGHLFPNEAVIPFKLKNTTPGFCPKDLPPPNRVFGEHEISETVSRLCRHCAHYVVNPFLQRCCRTNREVEATDTCAHFTRKQPAKIKPGMEHPLT